MSLFTAQERTDFAACTKEVIDVTGAGDTVLATLAVSYASGLDLPTCIEFANIAASCAIEKLGCVHVGKKELVKAISSNDTRFKYLLHHTEEIIPMLFAGEMIIPHVIDASGLHFELLTELAELKAQNAKCLIAAIIPDDLSANLIKSLCDLVHLDLIVPQSKKMLLKEYYIASVEPVVGVVV